VLTLLAPTHETKVTVAETREMVCALVILTFLLLAVRVPVHARANQAR
jgi:hypothetical protein